MTSSLHLILILLAVAVGVVVLCRILHLPAMLGYLLVGIMIGPHALGWIPDAPETRHLAEFGVVFLMFSIGLEFSLARLRAMQRLVFGLGTAQVAATMVLVMLSSLFFEIDWRAGLALGGILAMSSTAIVSKMLVERAELNAPHGQKIMGVLLFQDLAVVPLIIIIPALAESGAHLGGTIAIAMLKAAILLAALLTFGQRLLRPWFHLVAGQKSSELFMLNVLLFTLGMAWITELSGLSLALGAFVAGMLISETEYRYQVEEDIKPFRDVLLGLFFVTIGMMLDLHAVIAGWGWILLLLLILIPFKAAVVALLVRAFAGEWGAALRTGIGLAQAGEFGFVLLTLAGEVQSAAGGRDAERAGRHAHFHADCAVPDPACRSHRAPRVAGGMDEPRHADAPDRRQQHVEQAAHHHLRLRAQRTGAGKIPDRGRHQASSRSISIRAACAKRWPPGKKSFTATRANWKCCRPPA